jgi:hypothetical protein
MSENPHAGQGSVLLDIGGDIGALVVAMPSSMVGVEIEISPAGQHGSDGPTPSDPRGRGGAHEHRHDHGHHDEGTHDHDHDHGHDHRPHVAVVDRPVAEGSQPSLVFPELVEGRYDLFDKGEDVVLLTVEIIGGQVTFADWPRPSEPAGDQRG